MTEIEKLEVGLEYSYDDPEIEERKEKAIIHCREYNAIDDTDYAAWCFTFTEVCNPFKNRRKLESF